MPFLDKKDKYDQVLKPGDVCAVVIKDKIQLVVYKEDSWGGKKSKGQYGRFISTTGTHTLKYTGVCFAFDPMGQRRSKAKTIQESIRTYYEGK